MRKGIQALAGVALLATAVHAEAAVIGSGPLRIADLQTYSCAVVNIGTKPIDVDVAVTIAGGNSGNGASQHCQGLQPNEVCVAANDAGSTGYRFCTATTTSKKSVRGSLCDLDTDLCTPLQ